MGTKASQPPLQSFDLDFMFYKIVEWKGFLRLSLSLSLSLP